VNERRVYLGAGANIGDRLANLREGLLRLHAMLIGTWRPGDSAGLTALEESLLGRAITRVYARCALTGEAPPESAKPTVELWRSWLEERAGNSFFTGGAFRFAYRGDDDLRLVTEITDAELENVGEAIELTNLGGDLQVTNSPALRVRHSVGGDAEPERAPDQVRVGHLRLHRDLGEAGAEDLVDASFAGQYETVLDVRGAEVTLAAVKRCWASSFGSGIAAYRPAQGQDPRRMAVLIQRLVPAEAAGVAFTANPVTMTAGLAAMKLLTPDLHNHIDRLGDRARTGMAEIFARRGIPGQVTGMGSIFKIHMHARPIIDHRSHYTSEPEADLLSSLQIELLKRGHLVSAKGYGFVTTPMTEADIDGFLSAADDVVAMLRRSRAA